jgi:hypothetical protein
MSWEPAGPAAAGRVRELSPLHPQCDPRRRAVGAWQLAGGENDTALEEKGRHACWPLRYHLRTSALQ